MTVTLWDILLIYGLPIVCLMAGGLVTAVAIVLRRSSPLHADMERYLTRKERRMGVLRVWSALLATPCMQAIFLHRAAHALNGVGLGFVAHALRRLGVILAGIDIHPEARIGRGFEIFHGLGTVIGADVEIGENVLVCHGVSIGYPQPGFPKVGDNVKFYIGATVVGPFTIGEGARIGANALIKEDVPPFTTVVAGRARLIPHDQSSDDEAMPDDS